jgi:hypothetical protein
MGPEIEIELTAEGLKSARPEILEKAYASAVILIAQSE